MQSKGVLERPKYHKPHSPQRSAVTHSQNSQHRMACRTRKHQREKARLCKDDGRTAAGSRPFCMSARAASDGFGIPRNLRRRCLKMHNDCCPARGMPGPGHVASHVVMLLPARTGGPAVSPAESTAAPSLPRPVNFMSHRLVRPVLQRALGRGAFSLAGLSLAFIPFLFCCAAVPFMLLPLTSLVFSFL
jgi:hypothetical protein